MTQERLTILGGCHCGNLAFEMESDRAPEDMPLRTCGCRFCTAQGGLYTSDPEGCVRFTARDPERVNLYRFGHATADFLICRDCGVYLGAVMTENGRSLAVVNVRTCAEPDRFLGAPAPMDFDGESKSGRLSRRRAKWTPASLEFLGKSS